MSTTSLTGTLYASTDRLALVPTLLDRFPVLRCDWAAGRVEVFFRDRGEGTLMSTMLGHAREYHLPLDVDAVALTAVLRDEIVPLVEEVIAGYSVEWDGRNDVARFTPDAQEAQNEIVALMESDAIRLLAGGQVNAADWFALYAEHLPVTAATSDAELSTLAAAYVAEARGADDAVLDPREVSQYLDRLRQEDEYRAGRSSAARTS